MRILLAGTGAVTPYGAGADALWEAVAAGRSAISLLQGDEFAELRVRIGGQIRGIDADAGIERSLARRLSPVQKWAILAADEAMTAAGIAVIPGGMTLPWPAHRFAIIAATGSGPIDAMQAATRTLDAGGPRAVPFTLSVFGASDAAAAVLSQRYGARGASEAISATCASGAAGLGTGLRMIRHGYADAVLVVGMEDCLGAVNLASNARLGALASGFEDRPTAASRPFDAGRSGFVMSQGAGAILLESAEAWQARCDALRVAVSPVPPVELAGFGESSDAYHPTAPPPDGSGAALAMRLCLDDAGIAPAEVDHVNAHGTGTVAGDAAEIAALGTVFGSQGGEVPVTATKSATGHLLGAAGVVEAIIAARTITEGVIPPTINLTDTAFPEWDIVAGVPRAAPVDTVLSTSFGFGGHNGAVLLRRFAP